VWLGIKIKLLLKKGTVNFTLKQSDTSATKGSETIAIIKKTKKTKLRLPLVRKRTIPTEQPPLVGEVSADFCG
jgi:hypothetical protein